MKSIVTDVCNGYNEEMMINNIGILGGGQLGRMIAISAHELGMKAHVFADNKDAPAVDVTKNYIIAKYEDHSALAHFSENIDVATFEFENIPLNAIDILTKSCKVLPCSNALRISQNRILEKKFLNDIGIKTANFYEIKDKEGLVNLEFPFILKSAEHGYDGKSQRLVKDYENLQNLEDIKMPCIAESFVEFEKELSVIIARGKYNIVNFPVAENIHEDGILISSKVPASISDVIWQSAISIAKKIAEQLDVIGLLAVEFFLVNNDLIVNEIAPRPHNSGHWSMDATDISQFHALCLAITDNKLKQPNLINSCVTRNLLGQEISNWQKCILKKNHKVYIYGKKEAKHKRKMGHVNIIG